MQCCVTHHVPVTFTIYCCGTSELTHSSTVVEVFELSTERRARERQEYERLASEKESLRTFMEEEQRREEEQRKKEEISRMRQEQVCLLKPVQVGCIYKAQIIMHLGLNNLYITVSKRSVRKLALQLCSM